MANIGLIYFLFLIGLEMDMSIVKRTGTKAVSIAIAGMIMPLIVGVGISFSLSGIEDNTNEISYILYLGIVLSVTSFPVLARMLAGLKLINTELGQLALSTSLINDVCAWVLLALAIALSEQNSSTWASVWVIVSNIFFVAFCFVVVRPAVNWLIKKTPEGKSFSDFQICVVLVGVMISAFITDVIGTHAIFGAFVYGLVIPNGPLGAAIIEKLEDVVSGILLPLFYAISGLKTNINLIHGTGSWSFVFTVIPLACFGKVFGTLIISVLYDTPIRDGIVLGLLMNTKGLIEMIVLNIGREQKVLGDEIFSIMVVATLIMTATVSPIAALIYKPRKRLIPYRKRTIQNTRMDAELRKQHTQTKALQ
ncbi:hypothetical protein TSUD_387670 [Trifolium subterraneum]|uniref:Cation/H+ exchanger transmembrane domain-containing protein n=1 Tax=Trifolium subterraneum TaxID=3900 RepID=A0A2Z6NL49_TRISU|nr:hypothetical protein TSUD_387670 [Trifolium subterraneum]